ncbi:MAG: MGMT family protein [Caldisericia bacterium]
MAKKTKREQLYQKREREFSPTDKGLLLIPTPMDVAETMRIPKKGELLSVNQIRDHLAKKFGADWTCPMCTGIFMNIVAGASEENKAIGEEVFPWWRCVKKDGLLSDKYPGAPDYQKELLEEEGHTIWTGKSKRSTKLRVKDYEDSLITL